MGELGGLLARMNFALELADNKVPGVKVDPAQLRRTIRCAGSALSSRSSRSQDRSEGLANRTEDPRAGRRPNLGSPDFQRRLEVI